MDITYNSLNINDKTNYYVVESNHDIVAQQELNVQKIARSNDSIVLRKNYGTKVIKMDVIIKDSSRDNLDSRLDTFRETIETIDKNLDIDYASGTRRYVCSGRVVGIAERKQNWIKVEVEFSCFRAFGVATSATTESFLNKTTSPYADDIEIAGTAPAQPDIEITVDSLTATGEKYIQLKNTDNGDYVKVSADDWAADDVVAISIREKRVTRNGTITEYLGIVPEWLPGTNNWEYSDNFDARQVDIEFIYLPRYL